MTLDSFKPPQRPKDSPEQPTAIPEDVRARWADTHLRNGEFVLLDGKGAEIARVPFSDSNYKHYMGGPLGNEAREEQQALETINAQREEVGEQPLASLDDLARGSRGRRSPERRARDSVAYDARTRDRIRGNIVSSIGDADVDDQTRERLMQAIDRVVDHASARALADEIKSFPQKAQGSRSRRAAPAARTPGDSPPAAEPARRGFKEFTGAAGRIRSDHLRPVDHGALERLAQEEREKNQPEEFKVRKSSLRRQIGELEKSQDAKEPLYKQLKAIENADELDRFETRLNEVRGGLPAQPDARGVSFKNPNAAMLVEQDGRMYVREGKAVRFADQSEIDAYMEEQKAALDEKGARLKQGAPRAIETVDGTLKLEDLGATAHERVARKKGVDGIETHGPTSDDIPVEGLKHHPTLRGYYVDARGRIISPEAMKERQKRLAGRAVERALADEVEKLRGRQRTAEHVPPRVRTREERVSLDEMYRTDTERFLGVKARSLSWILGNKDTQQEFGVLIRRVSPEYGGDIVDRIAQGKVLTPLQEKIVNYARFEHTRIKQNVEFVRTSMTPDDLETIARFDQRFQATMGMLGAVRTSEIFKRELGSMAMQNPEMAERLAKTYDRLKKIRESGGYKAWESEIQHLYTETGVDAEDFGVVFRNGNSKKQREIEKKLTEKYRAQKGTFGRIFDGMFNISRTEARHVIHAARGAHERSGPGQYKDAVRLYGDEMRELAGMLKWATSEEPQVSLVLQQEAYRNEPIALAADEGPKSYAELVKDRTPSLNRVNTDLGARIRDFRYEGRDWDHSPVEAREAAAALWKDDFQRSEGTGLYRRNFFMRALQRLKEIAFSEKLDALIHKPVAA